MTQWLAKRLALLDKHDKQPPPEGLRSFDAKLKARLQAFRIAQGPNPDGRPRPLTLMMLMLNHATGLNTPRLATDG